MMIKIKISSEYVEKLQQDMELFNISSANDFYLKVVINTHDFLKSKNSTDSITKILSKYVKQEKLSQREYDAYLIDIALEIQEASLPKSYESKDSYIYIQSTKTTESQLLAIEFEVDNTKNSQIFRELIKQYLSFPKYLREQIVFQENYFKLKSALKDSHLLSITTNKKVINKATQKLENNRYDFELFDIRPGKEEYHTYITGYATRNNVREIKSFKLSTIKDVAKINKTFCFSDNDIKSLHEGITNGVAFMNSTNVEFKIKFYDHGELYKKLYKDRPKYKSIDNDVYTFSCPSFQMINYLKGFGPAAQIIEPIEYRNELINFYKDALNLYKNN